MPVFSRTLNKWIFYLILISLSISPAFATDPEDAKNYFLILCMLFGPVIVIFSGRLYPKIDLPIILLILESFLIQLLFNSDTFRISTIMFSCMYFVYFLAAIRVFKVAKLTLKNLHKILKFLIYAYAIVLIIQQFCVLTDLPVFNQFADFGEKNTWKLNSLSAEPSHTARYLGVLMYSYLKVCDLIKHRTVGFMESFMTNRSVWLSFLWVMLTMISGTAMIVIALIIIRYLKPSNIILIAGLFALIFAIGLNSDFKPLNRSTIFLKAVVTGDTDAMIKADHSASIRVVPAILCLERIEPQSVKGWTGEGIDTTSHWMSSKMPGLKKGMSGGAIANYMLEYGLLTSLLFIGFSLWCCFDPKNIISSVGFWIICVLFIGVNTQIGWLCILLLFIDKRISVNNANACILQQA